MGKAPAFQFYVRDWLSDPQLRLTSPSTRGIWIDILCFMWDTPERGKLETTVERLGRMVGANNGDIELFIAEAQELAFCNVSVTSNATSQNITLRNRRMWREAKDKENNRLRQQTYRDKKKRNAKITPPSSTASSTATAKSKTLLRKTQQKRFALFWKSYPKKRSKGQAEKAWNKVNPDEQLLATIIASIERAKNSADWLKNGGEFIPHPATWLRAKGWEDEYKINTRASRTREECIECGKMSKMLIDFKYCPECYEKR